MRIDIINHVVRTCRRSASIIVDVGIIIAQLQAVGPIFGIGKGRHEGSGPGFVVTADHCRERPRYTTLSRSLIQVGNRDVVITGETNNLL